jgi:signal transduction histidine kinase
VVSLGARLHGSLALAITGWIFGFVSLIILGVVGYLLFNEQQVLEQALQARGLLSASHLAQQSVDPILREDDYALFKLLQQLRRRPPETGARERILYAMLLDRQGRILAHTDPARLHTAPDDPRTREVLALETPSVVPVTDPSGERLYDVAVPILMRDLPIGAVRLGISRAEVAGLIRDLAAKVLSVLFLLMLLGIWSIWRFSNRIVRPIRQLRDGACAVRAGDLSRRVSVDRPDEIGQLAEAFNAMTEELALSRAEVRQKEEMRTRLLAQVITAQEDERKRISRELHDETGQSLTSLLIGLRLLEEREERPEVRAALAELRRQSGTTLDVVHSLALQLRPSVLDDLGLVPALERLIGEWRRTAATPVAFETNLESGSRLPAPLETALYRIAQEALTNIARHAGATSAGIILKRRRSSIGLIVEDNGRGFDVAAHPGAVRDERSLGLFGMRERATLLGGTLAIESAPGSGTTVFVELPLEPEVSHGRE